MTAPYLPVHGSITMHGSNDDSGPYAPWVHQHSQ